MTGIDQETTGANLTPTIGRRRRHAHTAGTAARSTPLKSTAVMKLLSRTRGATVAELATLTGWQPHSVRAYLSGLRKKGTALLRETRRTGDGTYRIANVEVADRASPAKKARNSVDVPEAGDAASATSVAA